MDLVEKNKMRGLFKYIIVNRINRWLDLRISISINLLFFFGLKG